MQCPSCESVIPLSPNWWLYRRLGESNYKYWCAAKPVANLADKRVDFQLVAGGKGKGKTVRDSDGDYDPDTLSTINRGTAKCINCGSIIEEDVIKEFARSSGLSHQLYSVVFRRKDNSLGFRVPCSADFKAYKDAAEHFLSKRQDLEMCGFIPNQSIPKNTHRGPDLFLYGITQWVDMFNYRQLLTLGTFVEVIDQAKKSISENNSNKVEVISTYLALILDRCVDMNSRLSRWRGNPPVPAGVSSSHSLNLMWNYPETTPRKLWEWCSKTVSSDYTELTSGYLGQASVNSKSIFDTDSAAHPGCINIEVSSADSLTHIADKSVDVVVTDPPYYDSIRYGEISDFFYVWLRVNLLDVLPNLFLGELTNKESEAIANPGRFRNMGESAEELADRDYEAKMALAFMEYHRVLLDEGVMIVQFNHKDSGAWDVLAKSLIDAGFEITASWAVSTENPRNLHQAQKNSVSSTVLLVCRKRNPVAGQAWWDDLRPELSSLVEQRAPEFEANDIKGIDLYLSAFGPALNIFSRSWPVLDSSGNEVRPEEAFSEARKAIANYRFRKLLQTDTAGFDPLTQWYILAWDAFRAREFPFDEARQLALAVGGSNVTDLAKIHKLLDSASGTCKLLSPQQRLKKRAFTINPDEFSGAALVDCLHAIIALYLEEQSIEPVRRFMKATGLLSNDLFMRSWEVALKVIPRIGDERKRIPEEKALADLWLAMDEIQAKVTYVQPELALEEGQMGLF